MKCWTRQALLDEAAVWVRQTRQMPTAHNSPVPESSVRRHFGKWNAFMAELRSALATEYGRAVPMEILQPTPTVITKRRTRPPAREHVFIPDTQNRADTPTEHLRAIANYCAEKRPHVIVIAGDWWDMPSLSAWDSAAKKAAEKRLYISSGDSRGDIEAGNDAMREFLAPIRAKKGYDPEIHLAHGNHEDRITRARGDYPELGDAISLEHLFTEDIIVHPFLEPFVIDGISYCHYYCVDSNGRVMGSKRGQASARAQINNVGMSATAGHKQGLDVAIKECAGGRRRGIIAGSFSQHDEEYLTPQGNRHWRGCLFKHEVRDGDYDLMELSLGYLLERWA